MSTSWRFAQPGCDGGAVPAGVRGNGGSVEEPATGDGGAAVPRVLVAPPFRAPPQAWWLTRSGVGGEIGKLR